MADQSDLGSRTAEAFMKLKEQLRTVTPKGEQPRLPAPPMNDLYKCALYLHNELTRRGVPYYFCGGFACINVGMTARTTADIDIAVPSGKDGYGVLLDIFSLPPFIQDEEKYLSESGYYFFVESTGRFVEVDGILAGLMAFPKISEAKIIKMEQLQLRFLHPASLLKLKMSGWANATRRKGPKRAGDTADIRSLRELMVSNSEKMPLAKLEGDEAKGLQLWVEEFKDLEKWQELDPSYGTDAGFLGMFH